MKYQLSDLIDIHKIQEITDSFYAATGIPTSVISNEGTILTDSGRQDICAVFHRKNLVTKKGCLESDIQIRDRLKDGKLYVIYKCPYGLVNAAAPIIVAGEHVANFFAGQFLFNRPDSGVISFFKRQAKEFGFNTTSYLKALSEIPIIPEDRMEPILNYLTRFAGLLVEMGLSNLKHIEASKELKKTHAELEHRVEERTAESVKANNRLRREIEERKRAEEALRESEEKYRSMMEAMNDPVYICSNDYRVTYMNPAMIKRIGTSDIEGIPCYKLMHGLDEKCQWCVHDKIQKGEHSVTDLISPKDGRVYHVSHSPVFHTDKSISKMTIFRDITEYKHAKQALRESEERYRTLTEHVADGVTLVQNGRFLFVNAAFVSMYGYTDASQIVGKRAVDLISCCFDQGIKEIYSELESGISGEKIFRAPCITREGREFWVEGHHNIIKWEEMPAILTTIRDITERRLREIAIQEETERLRNENIKLRFSIKERYRFGDIIGKSRPMQEIYELILKAANSDANVIIYGESGTGKEMVARAIHDMSNRSDKVFVAVNCGAIPETLLESEFFGYKKGAFTGANMDKHGYLDLAEDGTLFLDEVGELDLNMQVKLLRVIDGGGYTPVGSNKAKYSNFRIIAATNKNLMELVNKSLMREDFFYRMHVIPVTVPPLKERKEDIPLLVEHFLKLHCDGKERQSLPVKIFEAMDNHDWPGNVRELENVLKRYLTIQRLDFINPHRPHTANKVNDSMQESAGLRDAVELFEKDYIAKVLEQNYWHRGKTAKMLSIPERTLYRKLKQFQLTRS